MKRGFTIQLSSLFKDGKLPAKGCNPAARTGNAAGVHRVEKGKGGKYDRARQKARERREVDE